MARIVQIKELEARKRALVAESERYRQALKLDFQNLRLCGARWQRGFELLHSAKPWLVALPLLGSLLGLRPWRKPEQKPHSRWPRLLGVALGGWRLYRTYAPVMRLFAPGRSRGNGSIVPPTRAPAANT